MPWEPEDAPRHTHKADTPRLRSLWSEVANNVLAETGDEGRAVRSANAAVARVWRGGEEPEDRARGQGERDESLSPIRRR